MTPETTNLEQSISRAIRSNLDGLQRQSEELHQAIADLVAACSSSRPGNALPATLRAQSAAASLAGSLEVLQRFITSIAGQTSRRGGIEEEPVRAVPLPAQEAPAEPARHEPTIPVPVSAPISEGADISAATTAFAGPEPTTIDGSPFQNESREEFVHDPPPPANAHSAESSNGTAPVSISSGPSASDTGVFDLHSLPQEQQELHRRANRVAKVSMQDIQLLKPEEVKMGREHRDICVRLKDEIGKARKEYERRFGPILGHGVDYFYHWMVEVLAAGDPEALGEYPYSSPALRH